jgi:hypothetical protein
MSRRVNPYNKHRYHRHTKKTRQFGGADDDPPIKYKVTGKGNFIDGLSTFLAKGTEPTGKKTTKATIPRDTKDALKKKLEIDGYEVNESGKPGCRNCDREITTPLTEKFKGEYETLKLNVESILSAEVDVEIDPSREADFKKYAAKNNLDVKSSSGISVPVQDDSYTIDSERKINLSALKEKKSANQLKTIKVTISKDKKDEFETAVRIASANGEGYSCKNIDKFYKVDYFSKNATYELTFPESATSTDLRKKFTTIIEDDNYLSDVKNIIRYTAVIRAPVSEIRKFANGQGLVVKDSKGSELSLIDDKEYSVTTKNGPITQSPLPLIVSSFVINVSVDTVAVKTSSDYVTNLFKSGYSGFDVQVKNDGRCGPFSCDFNVTLTRNDSPSIDNITIPSSVNSNIKTVNSVRTNFQVSNEEDLRKLTKFVADNRLVDLKDSRGKTIKVDEKSAKLQEKYNKAKQYTITFTKVPNEEAVSFDLIIADVQKILRKADPYAFFNPSSSSSSSLSFQTTLDADKVEDAFTESTTDLTVKGYTATIDKGYDSKAPTLEELVAQGLSFAKSEKDGQEDIKYDEEKFKKLYNELVVENTKMKIDGTLIIKEPKELKDKMVLFNLLMKIKALVKGMPESESSLIDEQRAKVAEAKNPKPAAGDTTQSKGPVDIKKEEATLLEMEKALLLTERTYVATFFISINELRKNATGDLTPDAFKTTSIGNFFTRIYDVEKSYGIFKSIFFAAGRVVPIIAALRNYYKGYHTISFESKAIAEESLRQQRQEIETGIKNEFAIMSAFVGTKSQKVAGKTALIAAVASGLWGVYAQLQKNPETAAILAGVVAGCGPQAIVAAGILALCVASYYVYLKLMDKYAKYFIIIRTLNEFMIVLNKIERLVRLSLTISRRYNFNVNLKDVESQLKILFDRFNKMLSEDDVSQIEQNMKSQSKLPDFGAAAATAETEAEKAAVEAVEADATSKNQAGGGFGDFLFKVTFDVELWNQKLNDDVIKLNLHFTAAMAEFSMVLNVIQIDLLTSDQQTKKDLIKTANEAVTKSTEYRKMIIGILLNDILKLRVDYSYCNRGNWVLNTKSEGVCTDIENLEIDSVGNKRSKFKEKLHGLIKNLAAILSAPNPYPDEIKYRIKEAVLDPYVKMIQDAIPTLGEKNPFFLTKDAKLEASDILAAKEKAIDDLKIKSDALTRPSQKGGIFEFFSKSKEIKPSPERDISILQELKSRAYDFVSHESLMQFLMGVDKFVKAEGEPTKNEEQEAKKIADEIVKDAKISAVVESDLTDQKAKAEKLEADKAAAAAAAKTVEAQKQAEQEKEERDTTSLVDRKKQTYSDEINGRAGGRRLTRKRILNLKKNHHHHRRVSRTRAPFKSAAAALAAFRRG